MADPVNELISDYCRASNYVGSLPNKWRVFLEQEGYTFDNLNSAQYRYFGDGGYTGTFSERYNQWLEAEIYV